MTDYVIAFLNTETEIVTPGDIIGEAASETEALALLRERFPDAVSCNVDHYDREDAPAIYKTPADGKGAYGVHYYYAE